MVPCLFSYSGAFVYRLGQWVFSPLRAVRFRYALPSFIGESQSSPCVLLNEGPTEPRPVISTWRIRRNGVAGDCKSSDLGHDWFDPSILHQFGLKVFMDARRLVTP